MPTLGSPLALSHSEKEEKVHLNDEYAQLGRAAKGREQILPAQRRANVCQPCAQLLV